MLPHCLYRHPEAGLLGPMGTLLLVFWGASILLSPGAAPVYVPTSSKGGSFFLITSPALVITCPVVLLFNSWKVWSSNESFHNITQLCCWKFLGFNSGEFFFPIIFLYGLQTLKVKSDHCRPSPSNNHITSSLSALFPEWLTFAPIENHVNNKWFIMSFSKTGRRLLTEVFFLLQPIPTMKDISHTFLHTLKLYHLFLGKPSTFKEMYL